MKTARNLFFYPMALLGLMAAAASGQSIDHIEAFNGQTTLTNFGHVGDMAYIFGNGFTAAPLEAVTFNGVSVTTGSGALADSEIEVQIPAGATSGLVGLYFTSGVVVFSPFVFTVIGPGPYVTGFSPVRGGPLTQVTIEGFGFTGATNVFFNGVSGTNGFIQSDTQISIYTPAVVTTGPITVASPSGTFVTSSNFFVPAVISSFSPATGGVGASVVLLGANFTGATLVLFNGTPAASFNVNSSSNITAVVPSGATTGPISLVAPGGGYVTPTNFTILPTIAGFSPPGGPPGTLVTINGLNFGASGVVVEFNGLATAASSDTGGTNLTAVVPAGATTGPITVVNGSGSAATPGPFYLAPTLASATPSGGPAGTSVTVSGQNFTGATNVEFGALAAVFTVTSATTISAIVPNGIISGPVTVRGPGGSAPSGSATSITFYGPPVVNSLSTNAGPAGALVRISGLNLLGTTNLLFGGVRSTNFTIVSNSLINATVPNGVLTGPVSLSGLGGSFTTTTLFYGPPSITSFSPGAGGPGDEITISGRNLTGVTSVKFGSLGAAGYSIVDDGTIQAAVPSGASSGVVTVVAPGGTASSSSAFATGQVLLTASLTADGKLELSWPLSLVGWVLQTSSTVGAGASWTTSTAVVSATGNQNVATIQLSGAPQFYRLKN